MALDIIPMIGLDEAHSIYDKITFLLENGNTVYLTDIQRMLRIRKRKGDEQFYLKPDSNVRFDSELIWARDENGKPVPYGRRIFIKGFAKDYV